MDTLDLIRTFQEVARRGSFAGAARALDVSKPNVSKYVAELEARLGVRLFNRTTRAVSLTDAGALLLERSAPLMDMIELTRDELQQRAREPAGRLRLTAPHGLMQAGLARLLAGFMARHPAVSLSLRLDNRLVDLVEEGMDLALRVGRIGDENLIVRRLQRVEFVVAASPDYWQRRGLPRTPADLAGHEALTYTLLGPHPQWRFEVQGRTVSVPVQSRMDATDAAPLVHAAQLGLGVICLPRLLLEEPLASGTLQAVLPGTSARDVWLYAAYAQRRHNSAALRALLDALEAHWRAAGEAA